MASIENNEKCPECECEETFLQKEASLFTYIASIVAFLVFGFLSIFIIPLIFESSKSIVKRCADCFCVIQERELFSLPSLKDEILDIRLGKCSLVISRKYALVIILLFSGFYFFRYFTSETKEAWKPDVTGQKTEYTIWQEYLNDCGKRIYLSNSLKAKKKFNEKYKDQLVTWNGYYIAVENTLLDPDYQYLLTVKMKPTESKPNAADIYLKFNQDFYTKYSEGILNQKLGTEMVFKAKYLEIGDEYKAHEFELLDVGFLNNIINLDDIPINKDESKLSNLRGNDHS